MTQIYQHEEDGKRGDETFSRMLGIRGTFYFVGVVFAIVSIGFALYFVKYFALRFAIIFLLALLPVVVYFMYWFFTAYNRPERADYTRTMWLNFISATCLNIFFVYLFLARLQYVS